VGIDFLNNHWFLFLKSESENCQFQVLFGGKGKSESKNCWVWLFQKTAKNWQFS
jgi:hypothetical protein